MCLSFLAEHVVEALRLVGLGLAPWLRFLLLCVCVRVVDAGDDDLEPPAVGPVEDSKELVVREAVFSDLVDVLDDENDILGGVVCDGQP